MIPHEETSEIVLAANLRKLIAQAQRSNGVIEFVPQIGDFIATDEPLFKLYGGAASSMKTICARRSPSGLSGRWSRIQLLRTELSSTSRSRRCRRRSTIPTTAVIAIDQLHRLLRKAGNPNLRTDEILAKSGQLLVLFRTPNWEDFVPFITEIRQCGERLRRPSVSRSWCRSSA